MAVGSAGLPLLYPVTGIRLGVASAGIKQAGRKDLVVMEICEGAHTAAVFTRNAFCAAPVHIAKLHIQGGDTRYCLINTGNANAGTGLPGMRAAKQCCEALAELAEVAASKVLPFSTGVIGEPLPVEKIEAALPAALADLNSQHWAQAAAGIMTTDTRPKAASRQVIVNNESVTLTGIAKGAGMIKPNMATMLSYVATDADIETAVLQKLLDYAVSHSFNRITVDGDTSTNDACVLVATGKSAVVIDQVSSEAYEQIQTALTELCIELAQGLVRDGEGASKFVTIAVDGGLDEQECLQVAFTIAESPLVKTALFASDPNWGRLLAAIGRAGIDHLDVDQISIYINGVLIAENGCRAASYTEAQGQLVMQEENIVIRVELNRGQQQASVWTTDLSHEYVRINAEYRT